MKNITFSVHVLPHLAAIVVFILVAIFLFSPIFSDNKVLTQYDIQQFVGSSKTIKDYRQATGEEALWADAMFSGMPAYLISVQWGTKPLGLIQQIMSAWLPSPVNKIFLSFLCYYVMLLTFGIRPFLAMTGAIAFGLSSYMIIGIIAGHNGRIGAVAFMPLVVSGVHLVFTNRRVLGMGVTALAVALHLLQNHIQITFYLFIIVALYGIVSLIYAVKRKALKDFVKNAAFVCMAAVLGACTFFGQFWAISEYAAYSTRGKSELIASNQRSDGEASGISTAYAFEYSYGIFEPLIVMIPNFYGGATGDYLVQNSDSKTFEVLRGVRDEKTQNQLARHTSAYWGPQYDTTSGTAPYYGGAIMVFLFAVGIAFAEKKYVWWLASAVMLGIILCWGKHFPINYIFFDYLPGYNKFRAVTFALIIVLFSLPLLGLLGLERLWSIGMTKENKRKLFMAFCATGGVCFLIILVAGFFSFTNEGEKQLPPWLLSALRSDRQSLLRSDAFRSFAFISIMFGLVYLEVHRRLNAFVFYGLFVIIVIIDMAAVDKRYLTKDRFMRKTQNPITAMTDADQAILADKSYYRVYNLAFLEARTSYHHNSIGGYHGAKLRRYQDFYDSCITAQTQEFIARARQGDIDLSTFGAFNMLNVKYIVYGGNADNVIPNNSANGNAWFVQKVESANSATEELELTCLIDTKTTAVIDASKFHVEPIAPDSTSTITLLEHTPRNLKYKSDSRAPGLAVFSEIYYPKGWIATIDGKETSILRANYILRALQVPAGEHTIEFTFEPKAYFLGNKVTTVASWVVLLITLAGIGIQLIPSYGNRRV